MTQPATTEKVTPPTPPPAAPVERVLSVNDIMAADDVEYTTAPGFKPGEVFALRSLTAGDMIEWSEANEGEAKRTAGLRLIINSVVDGIPGVHPGATGKPIMNDTHISVLRTKTHKVTEALVKSIVKHNGMNVKDAAADAKKG
jgi:hypothetical protein